VTRQTIAKIGTGALSWSQRRQTSLLVAAVAYSLFLQVLALVPGDAVVRTPNSLGGSKDHLSAPVDWRDFGHLGVYGVLGIVWLWALSTQSRRNYSALLVALIVAPGVGVVTELSQYRSRRGSSP
jgi:VanZ family protein